MTLLAPLVRANGYEVVQYAIRRRPFHFRLAHELDLHNVDFEAFAAPGKKLLNLPNAAPPVVEAVVTACPDFLGVRIVRDPRQILVSDYFHHLDGHDVESPVGWVWDKLREDRPMLAKLSQEEGLLYELENITADVLDNQIAAWRPRPDVFEDKLENFEGADSYEFPSIARLVTFLDLPIRPELDFSRKFANDASRDWRETFTPKVTDAFKRRYGQLLIDLGYEQDFDW